MSNEKNSYVAENGLTLGIAVLALFVIFAVGLPRWLGGDAAEIALPERIGESGELFTLDTSPEGSGQLSGAQTSGRAALDPSYTSGLYVKGESDQVFVQAVRTSNGSPLWPTPGATYTSQGGATCAVYGAQQPLTACQAGTEKVTVMVTGSDTDTVAKLADQLVDELA